MNPQDFIAEAQSRLTDPLEVRGFSLFKHEYRPEAFGSAYIEYRRAAEAVRVVWDGKESWVVAQHTLAVNQGPFASWHDIAFDRVPNGVARGSVLSGLLEPVVVAVNGHLTQGSCS